MTFKELSEGILLTISGQSGVGKDTIINFVIKNSNFSRLPGYTTRSPRKEEICGFHYHFVTDEEFINAPERFLTITLANGYYYGYKLEEIEKNIKGGKNIIIQPLAENIKLVKQKVKNTISVLINPPSPETLVERMKKRGTQEKEITSRLKNRRLLDLRALIRVSKQIVSSAHCAIDDRRQMKYRLLREYLPFEWLLNFSTTFRLFYFVANSPICLFQCLILSLSKN